jgi:hypothetical protein
MSLPSEQKVAGLKKQNHQKFEEAHENDQDYLKE